MSNVNAQRQVMTFVKLEDARQAIKPRVGEEWSRDAMEAFEYADKMLQTAARIKGRSLPTDDGWEDIATAPRDGTVVWAYGTITGDWGYTPDRKDMAKSVYHSGHWCFTQPMGRHDPLIWQPTHWRPLPAPPSD